MYLPVGLPLPRRLDSVAAAKDPVPRGDAQAYVRFEGIRSDGESQSLSNRESRGSAGLIRREDCTDKEASSIPVPFNSDPLLLIL